MAKTSLIINAKVITAAADKGLRGIYINEEGRVADIFRMEDYDNARYPKESEVFDASGALACSGLIDTHIHGIGGFSTDQADSSSILGMSDRLASFGVTSFIPTLYAGRADKMEKEIKAVVSAMGKEKGARILGVNLEGPFLSPKKCGAQDSRSLTLPDAGVAKRLFEAAQGKALAMTMAPELEGAREVAAIAAQYGVVLLMGHTSATYEQALCGIEMGIGHVTHMFNAMTSFFHKAPGVAGAALMDDRLKCEIIADGVHVHRDVVKHVIKTKPRDNVVLITDSLGPASLGPGRYVANGEDVVLGEEGAFVDANDHSKLCGSALTLNKAVLNVVSWGVEAPLAVKMATENPAKIYGLKELGNIFKGALADIVIFDSAFNAKDVFIGGKKIR